MRRIRVIPVLLLAGRGLVKTRRFKDPVYLGDPINTLRIFNEKEVDEIAVLDIRATSEGRGPSYDSIREMAGECFMPMGYGGGVRTLDDARRILGTGVEKIIVNTAAIEEPSFVEAAAREFGSQSVAVSIDVRRGFWGKVEVAQGNGQRGTGLDPVSHARRAQELGAGEILLNSVERDGMMSGYDIPLIQSVSSAVSIPVVACGGAGRIDDFVAAVSEGGASAVAAGSLFVFQGKHRAVLISYPSASEIEDISRRAQQKAKA